MVTAHPVLPQRARRASETFKQPSGVNNEQHEDTLKAWGLGVWGLPGCGVGFRADGVGFQLSDEASEREGSALSLRDLPEGAGRPIH